MMPLAGKHITEWKFASREGIVPVRSGTGRTRMDPTSHSHTRCRVPMKWKPTKKNPQKNYDDGTEEWKNGNFNASTKPQKCDTLLFVCGLPWWVESFFFVVEKMIILFNVFFIPRFCAPNCTKLSFCSERMFWIGNTMGDEIKHRVNGFCSSFLYSSGEFRVLQQDVGGGGEKTATITPVPQCDITSDDGDEVIIFNLIC